MMNAVLTNMSKKILLTSKRFRSFSESLSIFLSEQLLRNVLLDRNNALSTTFFEIFSPVDWIFFGQPLKNIIKKFSISKCSSGHKKCTSHKVSDKKEKIAIFFAQCPKEIKCFFQKFMFFWKFLWSHWMQIRQPQRKKKNTQKT